MASTPNNVQNVSVAKPKVGGAIFVALHAIEYLIDVLHGDAACVQTAETEGGNN